jgi:hypothetical protein
VVYRLLVRACHIEPFEYRAVRKFAAGCLAPGRHASLPLAKLQYRPNQGVLAMASSVVQLSYLWILIVQYTSKSILVRNCARSGTCASIIKSCPLKQAVPIVDRLVWLTHPAAITSSVPIASASRFRTVCANRGEEGLGINSRGPSPHPVTPLRSPELPGVAAFLWHWRRARSRARPRWPWHLSRCGSVASRCSSPGLTSTLRYDRLEGDGPAF